MLRRNGGRSWASWLARLGIFCRVPPAGRVRWRPDLTPKADFMQFSSFLPGGLTFAAARLTFLETPSPVSDRAITSSGIPASHSPATQRSRVRGQEQSGGFEEFLAADAGSPAGRPPAIDPSGATPVRVDAIAAATVQPGATAKDGRPGAPDELLKVEPSVPDQGIAPSTLVAAAPPPSSKSQSKSDSSEADHAPRDDDKVDIAETAPDAPAPAAVLLQPAPDSTVGRSAGALDTNAESRVTSVEAPAAADIVETAVNISAPRVADDGAAVSASSAEDADGPVPQTQDSPTGDHAATRVALSAGTSSNAAANSPDAAKAAVPAQPVSGTDDAAEPPESPSAERSERPQTTEFSPVATRGVAAKPREDGFVSKEQPLDAAAATQREARAPTQPEPQRPARSENPAAEQAEALSRAANVAGLTTGIATGAAAAMTDPGRPTSAFMLPGAIHLAAVQPATSSDLPASSTAGSASAGVAMAALPVEIAARALEGKRRFEIRLDPPELGRIDVRLDFGRDGQVTSRLVVERAETLDLLRRDSASLERALESAGLRTPDSGLQFSLRDQSGQQRWAGAEPSARPNLLIVPNEDVTVHEAVRRGYGALRGLGSGLDIQV